MQIDSCIQKQHRYLRDFEIIRLCFYLNEIIQFEANSNNDHYPPHNKG